MHNQTPVQNDTRLTALMAALSERERAKVTPDPDANPFKDATMADLSHGLMKGADNMPAVNMATKVKTTGQDPDVKDIEDSAAFQMEAARFATAKEGREDKSARRMAEAKARAQRKVEFDQIGEIKAMPSAERMAEAWKATVFLFPIIQRIAKSKQRWANRLLNGNADDIPSLATESVALALGRQSKFPLDVIVTASEQLGMRENGIPGDQAVNEDDPHHVKQVKKARKWLMGMLNNRVMAAVVDSYTSQANLRWENLDILGTVMASINGVGDDPITNRFKADRAPAFLGTRFPSPGGIDGNVLAMVVNGAITAKGLDPLVEFLLNDDNRRVDGLVKWSECAESIFLMTPGGYGQWMWDQVVAATTNHENARRARGVAARSHVRNLFEWMPNLIVTAVEAFDPHPIGWSVKSESPVYSSEMATIRQVATIKMNRGAGAIPSPNPNFKETIGQPVGDEDIEEVEMVWYSREQRSKRAARVQAIMASDFELYYLPDEATKRLPLQPALKYGTVREAAEALTEYVARLTTGNDLVASAVNA